MRNSAKARAGGRAIRTVMTMVTLVVALSWVAHAEQSNTVVFDATTGFSGVQGSNGWSYVGVRYRDLTNLVARQVLGTFDPAKQQWNVNLGGTILTLTATQQNMTEGDARWSARCWTADRDYRTVAVASTLYATTTVGARLEFVPAATLVGSNVSEGVKFSTAGGLAAGEGTQIVPVNAWLIDVRKGDRVYFILQNAGAAGANGSFVLQTWQQKITAVPGP